MSGGARRILALHGGLLVLLLGLQFVLPAYHHGNLARIMVLASYAIGYNILFGYTGLLSLGHALFFAAGMYGMGLAIQHRGVVARPGAAAGLLAGAAVSAGLALLALRTSGGRLHDRDADVRAGGLPDDPLFRRIHPRRRGLRDPARRSACSGGSTSAIRATATLRR